MGYKKTGIPQTGEPILCEIKVGEKLCRYELKKPGEQEVFFAFKHMLKVEPDLLAAGRSLWETCAVAYDEEIRSDVKTFVAVCLDLQAEFVAISEEEVKKTRSRSMTNESDTGSTSP